MDSSDIRRLRLAAQRISTGADQHAESPAQPDTASPAAVLTDMAAVQAQDYPGAKWSLGLRVPGGTDAAIERALDEQSILRTWLMRGTLHLVAAADIGWLLGLLAPRLIAGNARRYQQLALDEPTLRRSSTLLANALKDSPPLTRPELLAALEQHGISTAGQRGYYMLQRASLDGCIAQVGTRGKDGLFVALDQAAVHASARPRDEALAALAERYFMTRGPATLHDFIGWSGLTAADAKAGLNAVQARLAHDTDAARTHYWSPAASPAPETDQVYLLPGFDEYLLSYVERADFLDPHDAPRIQNGGIINPMLVIDGRVVGTWRRTIRKQAVLLSLTPFAPLSPSERAACARAAQSFGAFLNVSVQIA